MRRTVWIAVGLAVLGTIAALPFILPNYRIVFLQIMFMNVALASSWNIIAGYTGYVSFGHAAFFGLGAYTAALLIMRLGAHWLLAAIVGGVVAALVALPLGYILLRLRGPYFAVSMLGLAAAFEVIANTWFDLTRGGAGLNLPPTLNLVQVYFAMAIAMLLVVGLSYRIITSRYGLRLFAIRDDEQEAEVLGINTTLHKVSAFVLSAFFPGVLGGLYAWSLAYIDPNSVFRPILSISMVILTMFGGIGTVLGPILGGVLLTVISEGLWSRFPLFHQAAYGALIILVVLFMPGGIVNLLRSRGWVPRTWRI